MWVRVRWILSKWEKSQVPTWVPPPSWTKERSRRESDIRELRGRTASIDRIENCNLNKSIENTPNGNVPKKIRSRMLPIGMFPRKPRMLPMEMFPGKPDRGCFQRGHFQEKLDRKCSQQRLGDNMLLPTRVGPKALRENNGAHSSGRESLLLQIEKNLSLTTPEYPRSRKKNNRISPRHLEGRE